MPQLLARLGSDDPHYHAVYMSVNSGPVAVFFHRQHAEEWVEQKEVFDIAKIEPCELTISAPLAV